MSLLEWGLQAALVLALFAALPMALRLERALTALRKDRAALAARGVRGRALHLVGREEDEDASEEAPAAEDAAATEGAA